MKPIRDWMDSQAQKKPMISLAITIFVSLVMAWISSGFVSLNGWLSFLAMLLISFIMLLGGWKLIKSENPPHWLPTLLLSAAGLRLALGVFWLLALPAWGYDTPVQTAGYIMADAYDRDHVAWQLSQTELPLSVAFQDYSSTDQYGGLLYVSAFIYRYLGSGTQQPMLIIILTAVFSAASILFAWAIASSLWGTKVAKFTAWSLTLYPEAVMLGSSQMREAFMVTLSVAGLYALLRYWHNRTWQQLAWIAAVILISLPLSYPFAILLLGVLAITALALDEWRILKRREFWVTIAGITLVMIIGNAFDLFAIEKLWPFQAARWQAFYSEGASGWVQRTFRRLPEGMEWLQLPFLVGYGVFRPLLPAALFDGIPLMRALAIWRALGWTLLLALLFYATFLAIKSKPRPKLIGVLLALVWGLILIASLRAGGDQWDNPRYRSAFAGIQLMLASWAFVRQQELKDPWLKRALVGTGFMVAWFIPWYLRRYTAFIWPVVAIHITIGLGFTSGVLYLIWDWVAKEEYKSQMKDDSSSVEQVDV